MSGFRVIETQLEGPLLIEPTVHQDERGFFVESYREDALASFGIDEPLLQENQSRSRRGVVRGMHFQTGAGMSKLVRCARGAILDVVVDIRRGSPTFGRWEAFELDDRDLRLLYCPIGFAHGFCVVSETADVVYKQSRYYDPQLERGFRYDDPDVGIAWPDMPLTASERDVRAPRLAELDDSTLFPYR